MLVTSKKRRTFEHLLLLFKKKMSEDGRKIQKIRHAHIIDTLDTQQQAKVPKHQNRLIIMQVLKKYSATSSFATALIVVAIS